MPTNCGRIVQFRALVRIGVLSLRALEIGSGTICGPFHAERARLAKLLFILVVVDVVSAICLMKRGDLAADMC